MTAKQKNLLDRFRDSSRLDMLDTILAFELEKKITASNERRETLQELLEQLWPEYLSGKNLSSKRRTLRR